MKRLSIAGLLLVTVMLWVSASATLAHAEVGEGPYFFIEQERLDENESFGLKAHASGNFTFTAGAVTITCKAEELKTGATIVGSSGPNAGATDETIVFTKCTVTGNGSECSVESEKITTNPLVAKLGYSSSTKSGSVYSLLQPETGKSLATLHFTGKSCTSKETMLEGSIVGEALQSGKVVEITNEAEALANEVHYGGAKTIWVEKGESLTETTTSLKAFGTSAKVEGTSVQELSEEKKWGVGALERVWWVEKMRLTGLAPPEKSISGTATLAAFKLEGSIGAPAVTIKCTSVNPTTASIKNRIEFDAIFVFEGCTVSSPASCTVREGAANGRITFKAMEGKLEHETVFFREENIANPVASFEIFGATCTEAGTYKIVRSNGERAFGIRLKKPENSEAEKKGELINLYRPTGVLTLRLNNETSGVQGPVGLSGEIGLKLAGGTEWNVGLP